MAKGAVMAEQAAGGGPAAPRARPPRPAKRGLPFGLTPRRLVEVAYVALLGFLAVRLVAVVLMPIEAPMADAGPAARAGIDADPSVFARFDPFGASGPAEAPTERSYANAAETTLDLRLVGVAIGNGVKSAVIELPDGRQKSFLVDEEVIGGVTLRDALPNQAILNRDGLTETLTLKEREGRGAGGGAPRNLPAARRAPPPAANGIVSPGQALDALSRGFDFRPVTDDDGQPMGFAIAPGPDAALFQSAGFAEGDVVVAVDGMAAPQNPERLLELMADLPPGRPFTVTVERGGVPLDVPVDLGTIR